MLTRTLLLLSAPTLVCYPHNTVTVDGLGVSITNNAAPQMNVVVVNRSTGDLISETPVFSKMRSANEATMVDIKDQIFVKNNFGHTLNYPFSQLVSNEPEKISLV